LFIIGIFAFFPAVDFIVFFVLLPAIDHIKMFLAIRRHNSQIVGEVGAQQLSVIFRTKGTEGSHRHGHCCFNPRRLSWTGRFVLGINTILQFCFPEIHGRLYSWAFSMMYLNSSITEIS